MSKCKRTISFTFTFAVFFFFTALAGTNPASASVPALSAGLAAYAPLTLDTDRLISFPGSDCYFSLSTSYAGALTPSAVSSNPRTATAELVKKQGPGSFLFRCKAFAPGTAEIRIILSGAETGFPVLVKQEAQLEVPVVLQLPELPSGCEITALASLLRFYGLPADKLELTEQYLPIDGICEERDGLTYRADPNRYFVGDPHSDRYGCYPPVIVETANQYLDQTDATLRAEDITGSDPANLYWRVANGTPVLIWATIGMDPPTHYRIWFDRDTGRAIRWLGGNHCLVLAGCTEKEVTMMDPLCGAVTYSRADFEERYRQHGKKAVILVDTGEAGS